MSDRPLKVLVVEDNATLRHLFAMQLEKDLQIKTCEASTLVEGALIAQQEPHFVILIDLTLDDAQELDAVHAMKRLIPGATLVVITGADEETCKACMKSGAHGVIRKGSPETLGENMALAVRKAVATHDEELRLAPVTVSTERMEKTISKIKELTRYD